MNKPQLEIPVLNIPVHPDTMDGLKSVISPELAERLRPDNSVSTGDFRIESNLSVVDGKVSDMIRTMLENADLNLFPSKGKAG